MRRRHLAELPALAHWFGVRPWEIERLTPAELAVMVASIPKPKPASAPGAGPGRKYGRR